MDEAHETPYVVLDDVEKGAPARLHVSEVSKRT
jgi:hypothetical protein